MRRSAPESDYWNLNTTVGLGADDPSYNDYRYHFDVLDWDVYKQFSGLRLFGGMRAGFLTFSARSSPAVSASPATIPYFRYADDINLNWYYYSQYYNPLNSSSQSDSINSVIVGPTAGLEGDVPIIGNLWADFGARFSILLADWSSRQNYSSTYSYYNYSYYTGTYYPTYSTSSSHQSGHFMDNLFVPKIYTGLELRWTHAALGAKFEVQKWQSDQENYNFQSPTIVGIGGTLTARF